LKLLLSDQVRDALRGYDSTAERVSQLPSAYRNWDDLSRGQYLEMTTLLAGYILSSQGDRVAMAHGVEGRFPFLDPDVVAFGSRLPPQLKLRRLDEKYVLKQLAARVVPTPVWRRAKQPYRAPGARSFFAGHAGDYVEDLLSPDRVRRDGIFHPRAVELLVAKYRAGRAVAEKDDMALVAVLSTQILLDRFVNHFEVTHGSPYRGAAAIHHG
jgi:asparagine synthase (glutamine-hydrolysing)